MIIRIYMSTRYAARRFHDEGPAELGGAAQAQRPPLLSSDVLPGQWGVVATATLK